jgi:hypothetical protein
MEQFGDRQVGDLIVDRRAEEDDPLVEEARVDVEGAFAMMVCSTTIGINGLIDALSDSVLPASPLRLQENPQAPQCSLLQLLVFELHRTDAVQQHNTIWGR